MSIFAKILGDFSKHGVKWKTTQKPYLKTTTTPTTRCKNIFGTLAA